MYMIAGLCMLKLYQKRHPDINASAYSAYACLAIVIFFSVLGVVRPRPTLHTPPPTTPAGETSAPSLGRPPSLAWLPDATETHSPSTQWAGCSQSSPAP